MLFEKKRFKGAHSPLPEQQEPKTSADWCIGIWHEGVAWGKMMAQNLYFRSDYRKKNVVLSSNRFSHQVRTSDVRSQYDRKARAPTSYAYHVLLFFKKGTNSTLRTSIVRNFISRGVKMRISAREACVKPHLRTRSDIKVVCRRVVSSFWYFDVRILKMVWKMKKRLRTKCVCKHTCQLPTNHTFFKPRKRFEI